MNRAIKAKNGNREVRNVLKIAHWNCGNKLWENKKDAIEVLMYYRKNS